MPPGAQHDALHGSGNFHDCHGRASGEGFTADGGDGVGNGDAFQIFKACKAFLRQCGYSSAVHGKGDIIGSHGGVTAFDRRSAVGKKAVAE